MPRGYYKRPSLKDRLLRRIQVTASGCWEWTGFRDKDGYGRINVNGKETVASRAMWTVCKGQMPPGQQVYHSCDNPPCINPNHLFLGTALDNALDSMNKGRKKGINLGEANNTTAPTTELVLQIRSEYTRGVPQTEIANNLAVHKVTVHNIVRRKTWKHA